MAVTKDSKIEKLPDTIPTKVQSQTNTATINPVPKQIKGNFFKYFIFLEDKGFLLETFLAFFKIEK